MSAVQYLTVRNFGRFQHYQKQDAKRPTRPAWIKLYASLLHDYEFQSLSDEAKSHIMLIWLLISQRNDRQIPNDPKWVAAQIGAESKVDLNSLIDKGFLVTLDTIDQSSESTLGQNDEVALEREAQMCLSSTSTSTSSSQEGESEGKPPESEKLEPEDLMEGWNEICVPAGLPSVEKLSGTRRQKAKLRLHENPRQQFWEDVMNRIVGSAFLRGLRNGNGKHEKWKASFDWLIENDTNCVKIHEGRYDG